MHLIWQKNSWNEVPGFNLTEFSVKSNPGTSCIWWKISRNWMNESCNFICIWFDEKFRDVIEYCKFILRWFSRKFVKLNAATWFAFDLTEKFRIFSQSWRNFGFFRPFHIIFDIRHIRPNRPNIRPNNFGRKWPNIRPNIRYSVVYYKYGMLFTLAQSDFSEVL